MFLFYVEFVLNMIEYFIFFIGVVKCNVKIKKRKFKWVFLLINIYYFVK